MIVVEDSIEMGRKWVCLEAAPRFELGIKVLQTSALPLGHAALSYSVGTFGLLFNWSFVRAY